MQFVGIALHPTNMDIAYGGSQDNGTSQFNDAYAWTLLRGGDGGFVRVDPNHPNTIYHEYQRSVGNGFLERSDDGGLTWTAQTSGINVSDPASFYIPYVMDPANSSRLLLVTNRVYETTDRADDVVALSTPKVGGWPVSRGVDSVPGAPMAPSPCYTQSEKGHP